MGKGAGAEYKTGGGAREVLSLQKGASFSHAEGGSKRFPPFKGGWEQNVLPCLGGGGHKQFRTRDFPIL